MKNILVILFFFLSFTSRSQSLMTVGEIYDYSIGDIFITRFGGYAAPPVFRWDTIVTKYYSTGLDTVFYTRNSFSYQPPACQTCTGSTSYATVNFYYTNLTDTIGTGLGTKPADLMCIDTNGYTGTWLDTVYYNPYFCSVLTTTINHMGNGPVPLDSICWWYFEPYYGYDEYAKGLGHTKSYWNTCSNGFPLCESGYYLLYYKKGTDSCGSAATLPTGLIEFAEDKFILFPNPVTNELTIENPEYSGLKIKEIEIYSSLGEKVFSQLQTTNHKHQTVDVTQLPSGIYFITVKDQTGNRVTRKVVKL